MFEVAIKGGEVIDGTGAPRRRADVAIDGGRIVAIGDVGRARRTIDASGRIVAPGFVDVHTHIDAQVFWDPALTPSCLYGVTTMLAGNCGFTLAPITEEHSDYLVRMLAIVEGMPLEALQAGVPCNWTSTRQYLERLDGALSINSGFMVGHSALRRVVMGTDATRRTATKAEMAAMVAMLRDGLDAGALGFSSSYGLAHSDAEGDPVPSRYAPADELVTLARQCRDFAGTSLEFLPKYVDRFDTEQAELLTAMSAAAQRPLNWNVLRPTVADRAGVGEVLRQADHARSRGGKVVALTMPIPSRARFSFATGFVLNALPGWSEPLNLPPDERLAALAHPEVRARLAAGVASTTGSLKEITEFDNRYIAEVFEPSLQCYVGRMLSDIARDEGKPVLEALLDIVCADQLRTVFTRPVTEPSRDDWSVIIEALRGGGTIFGASDAGAHLDFTAYFDYPIWIIDKTVRKHGVLTLEDAVQQLTSIPSDLYGLVDRGRLAEGFCADVVVFDADTCASGDIVTRFDLPSGAGRFYSEPVGVDHVLVNGVPIVEDASLTGERPGTLLRAGRDTRTPSLL